MLGPLVAFMFCTDGIAVDAMRELLRERASQFDRAEFLIETQPHAVSSSISPFDRARWFEGFSGAPRQYRVQLARPNILVHALDDDPDRGLEPARIAIADGVYTLNYDRPAPAGDDVFITMPMTRAGLPFSCVPILAVLDYHYFDSSVPFLNALMLFDEFSPVLVGSVADVSTYTATVPMPARGTTQSIELDLDARGMTRRFRATCAFTSPDLQPYTLEMYVLSTAMLGDTPYPSECIYTVRNPNVPTNTYGLHRFCILSAERDDGLTPGDCALPIRYRSSYVSAVDDSGICVRSRYDAAGAVVEHEQLLGTTPLDVSVAVVPRESIRTRWLVAAFSVAAGALMSAALVRRHRRTAAARSISRTSRP